MYIPGFEPIPEHAKPVDSSAFPKLVIPQSVNRELSSISPISFTLNISTVTLLENNSILTEGNLLTVVSDEAGFAQARGPPESPWQESAAIPLESI